MRRKIWWKNIFDLFTEPPLPSSVPYISALNRMMLAAIIVATVLSAVTGRAIPLLIIPAVAAAQYVYVALEVAKKKNLATEAIVGSTLGSITGDGEACSVNIPTVSPLFDTDCAGYDLYSNQKTEEIVDPEYDLPTGFSPTTSLNFTQNLPNTADGWRNRHYQEERHQYKNLNGVWAGKVPSADQLADSIQGTLDYMIYGGGTTAPPLMLKDKDD